MLKQMRTGYPRFFIHRLVETLAGRICEKLEHELPKTQMAMLFPSEMHALQCERYLKLQAADDLTVDTGTVSLASNSLVAAGQTPEVHWEHAEIHVVLYPADLYPLAKGFWQHTGFGITSRYADFCLGRLDDLQLQTSPTLSTAGNNHTGCPRRRASAKHSEVEDAGVEDEMIKGILRCRIANLASSGKNPVEGKDVYLFPSGMAAISSVAHALHPNKDSEASHKVVAYG